MKRIYVCKFNEANIYMQMYTHILYFPINKCGYGETSQRKGLTAMLLTALKTEMVLYTIIIFCTVDIGTTWILQPYEY